MNHESPNQFEMTQFRATKCDDAPATTSFVNIATDNPIEENDVPSSNLVKESESGSASKKSNQGSIGPRFWNLTVGTFRSVATTSRDIYQTIVTPKGNTFACYVPMDDIKEIKDVKCIKTEVVCYKSQDGGEVEFCAICREPFAKGDIVR